MGCYLGSLWRLSGTNFRLQDSLLPHVSSGSCLPVLHMAGTKQRYKTVKSIPEIKSCVKPIKA